jgi:hypothetical protein
MNKAIWFAMSLPFTALACAETLDETPFESRSSYVNRAASKACERVEECGEIGSDKDYNTTDDCEVAKREDFNSLWPSDECEDGRINGDKYEGCLARISSVACDGFANLADNVSFASECNADKVCTDAP